MAKRRVKKRTHAGAKGTEPAPGNVAKKSNDRSPKSMVIRIGASEVGPGVTQLVKDVRSMMEPETASRLKERRSNKLRDYTTMAGPLGVTHLLLFSRSRSGNTNLRLAVTPRGPTLHFRVESYSLCKDVHRSQKRPRTGGGAGGKEFLSPPLLVMNNFSSRSKEPQDAQTNGESNKQIPKHLESLTTTVFQSLFPPINPTSTPLKNIKRVLLLDRSTESDSKSSSDTTGYTLNLRHYTVETCTAKSIPKPLRRLDAAEKLPHAGQKRKRGNLPNLGKLNDVADYLLDPHAADGFTSGLESEPETDAEVEVLAPTTQKPPHRTRGKSERENGAQDRGSRSRDDDPKVEKKGVKLHELGPRLQLRLLKVEEGLCTGKVMWHSHIEKSTDEVREMEKAHEARRVERERRRAEQRANVEKKKKERGLNGEGDDEAIDGGVNDESGGDDDDMWDDAVDDDVDAEGGLDAVSEDAMAEDGEDEIAG